MSGQEGLLVVGFIGFGEAAFALTLGLRSAGLRSIEAYDVNQDSPSCSALIEERATEVGVILSRSCAELVRKSNLVVSANSSSAAIDVARNAAPFLTRNHIYVDINAAGPETMQEVGKIVSQTGAKFVDAAVMGPVPKSQHKVPILASGDGAAVFAEVVSPYGMNIQVLGDEAGRASATKLIRSIFMKGAAALLYELCVPAIRYEVVDLVLDGICKDMDAGPFLDVVTRLISGTAIHAGRRVHEMEDVLSLLEQNGVRSSMSSATKETLQWIDGLGLHAALGGKLPGDFHDALHALSARLVDVE